MSDLISRQAVDDVIYDYSRSCDVNYAQIMEYIDKIPSVENRGEWIYLDECANSGYYCSICHKKLVKDGWSDTVKKINFCPNCGARMKGGE